MNYCKKLTVKFNIIVHNVLMLNTKSSQILSLRILPGNILANSKRLLSYGNQGKGAISDIIQLVIDTYALQR